MNLILALLIAFPGTRVANLPTGRNLERGIGQIGISHRFLAAEHNDQLRGNPLNFLTGANVRVTFDYGITRQLVLGLSGGNASRDFGLNAAWAASRWTTVSAGAWADVIERRPENTWGWLGIGLPWTFADRLHVIAQPRASASLKELLLSFGAGAQLRLPADLTLGLETEPVIYGASDRLAWNLALDKRLGWHNFTLVAGNNWDQVTPRWFSHANRDITRGRFRLGFNVLRKI